MNFSVKPHPLTDFNHRIHLVNVGEGRHRCWIDSQGYGFLSAGQQRQYGEQLDGLQAGDVIVAYLNEHDYVVIGIVEQPPMSGGGGGVRCRGKKTMKQRRLRQPKICWNADDVDDSEYLVRIRWIKSVDAQKAKWKAKKGLFTTRLVRASLANQTKTLKFLESEFGFRFKDLVKG